MSRDGAIAAIVLAAGKSERMQYPKPLLIFGKDTALDHIIAKTAAAGCEPVIAVLGHDAARVRENASLAGATVVENPDYELGQTSSLQAGLRLLPAEAIGFVVYPVDHPLVSSACVDALIAAWRGSSAAIVAPSLDGRRGHPIVCDRALAAEFLALDPSAPARTVTGADPGRIQHVVTDDTETIRDLDEPADYHEALEVYSARGGEAGFLAKPGSGGRPMPKKPPV